MNTVQLECFLAVTQFLNFSKAAEAVKISQPAVSHQIHTLEDELGTKLFVRTSKSVQLTPAGLQFMGDADNILKIARGAKSRLMDRNMTESVYFNIGCHDQFELNLLPPIIRQLRAEFPHLHPGVKLIPFQAMENLLEIESIQAMLTFKNEHQKKAIGIYQEVTKCPIACVCAPGHPLSGASLLTEKQLTGPTILIEPRKGPPQVFQIQNRVAIKRMASELYFGDGYESTMTLIKSGVGFALYPDLPEAREPGLCYIPLEGFEPVSFGISYKSLKDNPILKRFLQLSKEVMNDMERDELASFSTP